MKNKVVRKIREIVSLALVAILFVCVPTMELKAAGKHMSENGGVEKVNVVIEEVSQEDFVQNSKVRTALYNCLINVACSSNGMYVEFLVNADGKASVIGVKDIKIQKKVWYGWKTVVTSDGAEGYNAGIFGCSLLYSGAEYGETYRITCVNYANVDGYTEGTNEIDSFVFTY